MIVIKNLYDKKNTGDEMKRLIDRYSDDLDFIEYKGVPLSKLKLFEFFDFVKNIPYRKDISGIEVIARPKSILNSKKIGMDCKKKSILIAAYCKKRNFPCRLIASSKRPDGKIHHVFPQIEIDGMWHNMDATYSTNKPLEVKHVTRSEIL